MPSTRRAALALTAALVAGMVMPVAVLAGDQPDLPRVTCDVGGWDDEYHPPPTIKVKRTNGPYAGNPGVEVVPFWDYVAMVLRIEYGAGGNGFPLTTMRAGALAVKQYGWYYAMHWRGGNVNGDCYDVVDTTADQIYKPVDATGNPINPPSAVNYAAMSATWHVTIRRYLTKKKKVMMILTGYRSGKKVPCGQDADGFRLYQKSLRDCAVKGLTLEETWRKYYEPRLYIVDVRDHDILADEEWRGDVGVLTGAGSETPGWRVYGATDSGFDAPATGSFSLPNDFSVIDQGAGDVNGDNLADLIMLIGRNNARRLFVALANGSGYGAASVWRAEWTDSSPNQRLLVADFDGDLRADAGLIRGTDDPSLTGDESVSLSFLRSNGTGFEAPVDWWSDSLDPQLYLPLAADVNGDGKADLVLREDASPIRYWVAASVASCLNFSARGPCTSVGSGLGEAEVWLEQSGWTAANLKHAVVDESRDGRDDVVVVKKDGANGVILYSLRAHQDATFAVSQRWQQSMAFGDVRPVGLHGDADGFGDVAIQWKDGANTKLFWLRTTTTGMQATVSSADSGLPWAGARPY